MRLISKNYSFNQYFPGVGNDKSYSARPESELEGLRPEKMKSPQLLNDPDRRLKRKLAKARLALEHGIQPEKPGSGISEAYFLRSDNGKRVGLFKPSMKSMPFFKKIINLVKRIFRFQGYFLKGAPTANIESEKAAYIVSRKGGFGDLVPPTTIETIGGVKGSFMLMAKPEKGHEIAEFEKVRKDIEAREHYDPEEINRFQKFAVYDYLINNLDRHHMNWMVEHKYEGGTIKLVKIHAIDHDRSFARGNPSIIDKWGSRSQYKWRETSLARERITDETKNFINQKLTGEKLESIINEIDESLPGFLTIQMKQCFREKGEVLRKVAADSCTERKTFAELGHLRTDRAIRAFLTA